MTPGAGGEAPAATTTVEVAGILREGGLRTSPHAHANLLQIARREAGCRGVCRGRQPRAVDETWVVPGVGVGWVCGYGVALVCFVVPGSAMRQGAFLCVLLLEFLVS